MKTFRVNEIFYSLQGEGGRAGTPNVFVRFAGCNLTCRAETEGFDCDTEFTSGRTMTAEEILGEALDVCTRAGVTVAHGNQNEMANMTKLLGVIFTGGEPALQLTEDLVTRFSQAGFVTAIETNGTAPAPLNLDYVVCSPKSAEHTLRVAESAHFASSRRTVEELKYVRRHGQGIPKPALKAMLYIISPAAQADGSFLHDDLEWCIDLVKKNPLWRLSVQQHKLWRVR